MDDPVYLIQYGVMGHVGRFRALPECGGSWDRGQVVVIQTDRGVELGEVLIRLDESATRDPSRPAGSPSDPDAGQPGLEWADRPRVLRLAGPDDLDRSHRAEALRPDRFTICRRILQEAGWPWELIDVEPMLDDRAMVLHYLGPHQIDAASWRARFRMTCDFDVVLEPVGADPEGAAWEEALSSPPPPADGGGCASCGRSGGGCGTPPTPEAAGGGIPAVAARGCAATPDSACSACGIGRLLAERRSGAAR